MSLIFGNLTQQFVEFQTARNKGVDAASTAFLSVAAEFRHKAAIDASYLAAIGKFY